MKILHVADLHLRWFDWVSAHATAYDLLVIAGDLQDAFSELSAQSQAAHCTKWLLQLPTPTIVCSGNHDVWGNPRSMAQPGFNAGWLQNLEGRGNIIATDGQSVELRGLQISVVGWLHQPKWPRSTDIVVAHAPPAACYCASEPHGSRDLGDSDLRMEMRRHPTALLALCGHVHEPRRRWSRIREKGSLILVPGCDLTADQPWHWEIDTVAGVATAHAHPDDPVETVNLFPSAGA